MRARALLGSEPIAPKVKERCTHDASFTRPGLRPSSESIRHLPASYTCSPICRDRVRKSPQTSRRTFDLSLVCCSICRSVPPHHTIHTIPKFSRPRDPTTARRQPCRLQTKYETRRRDPNPRTAALLVIDVQGHFASLAAPAMPAIARTVALCRAAGMPVVYTRHVDPVPAARRSRSGGPGTASTPARPRRRRPPRAGGPRGGEEYVQRVPRDGAGGGAARGGRDDRPVLRDHRARRVRARVPGLLLRRRHGHGQPGLHEATLANLAYGFAYIVDCNRLEAALGKAAN
ncbi:hypothetical protein PR202_gb14948 [Eleusine coracana subsp. coracana]|uniref:Isochorismatase-like domain-containing protein n=1 Tax=Eleusine coracana subsp. coracana TaxID=191504 RepID=A0AAV5EX44_ELECO|nr:hypothetical protein PR202_gb14948 [Eleusine coracana subsp. coracana]